MNFYSDPSLFPFFYSCLFSEVVCNHLYSCYNQKSAEQIHNPCKPFNKRDTGKDKYRPENESSNDSPPEKYIMLIPEIDLKRGEYENKTKRLYNTQRLFNQICSKELQGRFFTEDKQDSNIKNKCKTNPEKT